MPAETLENVLGPTACVTLGGSNRESVVGVEAAFTDGGALQTCSSPRPPLPPLPASLARTSRTVAYASCTAESAAPMPNESRSHTNRMSLAEPNKSADDERAGRNPGPGVSGLGTGASVGVSAEDGGDTGDGVKGGCC